MMLTKITIISKNHILFIYKKAHGSLLMTLSIKSKKSVVRSPKSIDFSYLCKLKFWEENICQININFL